MRIESMRWHGIMKLWPAILLLFACSFLRAAPFTWTGLGDGVSWTDPNNWAEPGFPNNPADDVTIAIAGAFTIQINILISANSLNLIPTAPVGTLQIGAAGGLSLSSPSMVNGNAVLEIVNGGRLTVNGSSLDIFGNLKWDGGIIDGTGMVTIQSGAAAAMNGPDPKELTTATLNLLGNLVWSGSGDWMMRLGANLQISSMGNFDIQNDQRISNGGPPSSLITNQGLVGKSMSPGMGDTSIEVPFNNQNQLVTQAGSISLNGGGTHVGGQFTANSPLNFRNSDHAFDGCTFGGGNITHFLNGTFTFNNNSTLIGGSQIKMISGVMDGLGTLNVDHIFDWEGGAISDGVSIFVGSTGSFNILTFNPKILDMNASIQNMGTMTLISGNFEMGGAATILNQSSFEIQSDGDILAFTLAGQSITNDGIISKTGTEAPFSSKGTGRTQIFPPLHNNNTINVQTGVIELNGDGNHTGDFTTSAVSAAIEFRAGTHVIDAMGMIGPAAFVKFTGGVVDVNGSLNIGGVAEVLGGTVRLNNPANFSDMVQLYSGTLEGTGLLTIINYFDWQGGFMRGSGTTELLAGAVMDISGGAPKELLDSRQLTQNGIATWTGSGDIRMGDTATWTIGPSASLNIANDQRVEKPIPGQTPAIANQGQITKTAGPGTSQINVTLDNTGNIHTMQGTIELNGDGAHTGGFTADNGTNLQFAPAGIQTLIGVMLTGSGDVSLAGGILDITGTVSVSPGTRFLHSQGELTGAGQFMVSGTYDWLGGSQTGSGMTNILAGAALNIQSAASKQLMDRTLINDGIAIWTGGPIDMTGTAQIQNTGGFEARGPVSLTDPFGLKGKPSTISGSPMAKRGGPMIINSGQFRKTQAGTARIGLGFVQQGLLGSLAGTLRLDDLADSSGNIELNGGNFEFPNGLNLSASTLTGSGTIFGNLVNSSLIQPAGPGTGTLIITGNYTQALGGALGLEIGGTLAGQFDQLQIGGTATLDGTLLAILLPAFQPVGGEVFPVLTYTALIGDFADITLPQDMPPILYQTNPTPTSYNLRAVDSTPGPGNFSLNTNVTMVPESVGFLVATVTRSDGAVGEVSVNLNSVSGTATVSRDYILRNPILVFQNGEMGSKTVSIPIVDDDIEEGPETFTLQLENPSGGAAITAPGAVVITIEDDDFSFANFEVTELTLVEGTDSAKRTQVSLDVVLSGPNSRQVFVPYTVSGSATPGLDHTLLDGQLLIPPGQPGGSLIFNIIGDRLDEATEEMLVTLRPGNVFLGDRVVARVVILDDDEPGSLRPETAIISPRDGSVLRTNQVVPFEAVGTSEIPGPLTFNWEICRGSGGCFSRVGRVLTDVSFTQPGSYRAICFAVDAAGNVDPTPAVTHFRVDNNQRAPSVKIVLPVERPVIIAPGESVEFFAQLSDPDADLDEVFWFCLNDPTARVTGTSFSKTFDSPGKFTVAVKANGRTGGRGFDSINVLVFAPGDRPNRLLINEPADRTVIATGEAIAFRGSVLQGDSSKAETRLFWQTGDGRTLSGATPSNIVYSKPGRYRVKFQGIEGKKRMEETITLFVTDGTSPPMVDLNIATDIEVPPIAEGSKAGTAEIFLRAVTRDSLGFEDLSYLWDFGDGRVSYQPIPGLVSFPEGVHQITLRATSPAGMESAPTTRTITVRASDDSRFEPNDNFEQAPMVTPGRYDQLALDDESQSDFFRVRVPQSNQRLVIDIEADGPAIAEILDSDQQPLSSRNLEAGANSLQLEDLEAGDYFIQIRTSPAAKRAGLSYGLSINVLNPALFFPGIREDELFATQIGLVNLNQSSQSVDLFGYDRNGSVVQRIQLTLPVRGRLNQTVGSLFQENAAQLAWIEADATGDLDGYMLTQSHDSKEMFAISAATKLSPELYAPHIAEQTQQWFTRASVINGRSEGIEADLVTSNGNEPLNLQAAFTDDSFDFLEKLSGVVPEDAWAVFREISNGTSMAGVEVFGTTTEDATRVSAGLQLLDSRQDNPNFTYVDNNLYFTHIASDTQSFYTGLALVNITPVSQGLRLRPFDSNGTELGTKSMTLEANQKLVSLVDSLLGDVATPSDIAWLLVEADTGVAGFELFGSPNGKILAGLEASDALRDSICFPYIDAGGATTHGIAVINPNASANMVTFNLYDDDGALLATEAVSLSSHQKLSIVIADLFASFFLTPQGDQVPGWMTCTGENGKPIAGFELILTNDNEQMAAIIAR